MRITRPAVACQNSAAALFSQSLDRRPECPPASIFYSMTEPISDTPVAIPLAVPDLRGREAEYLAQCVADNWVSSAGPFVTAFEERVARYTGRRFGVSAVNGTAALQLLLTAVNIGKGDRVLVPDFTFAATANAVIHAGAEPVFVDVSPDDWAMDPAAVGEAVSRFAPKAVLAVHVLGLPAPVEAIAGAAPGKPVIEDAAGAIGARFGGQCAGALGDAAFFSFNGNKTVTAGGGGMIVTDDRILAERARHLSTQARTGAAYLYDAVGNNLRLTNINAAVGLAQMERLDEMLAAKRAIAATYDMAFTARSDMVPMPRPADRESACWLYSVRLADREEVKSLIDHLASNGIVARSFWEGLSRQAPYCEFPALDTPVTDALSGTILSLPCSSQLAEGDQARVIDAVMGWQGAPVRALG